MYDVIKEASMSFDLEACYTKMNTGKVLLAYKGSITSELITNILGVVETKLHTTIARSSVRKRIYNVLVESLQNLYHHIDDLPTAYNGSFDVNFGIFVIAKCENGFRVSTGNFIRKEKVQTLKERLSKISSLHPEELKELYKFVLNNQQFSEKGGGGLGLIDIARRTDGNIDYRFEHYDEEFDFFHLEIYILGS